MTAIGCAIIGVPDQALSPYKLDIYDAGIRRAVEAIELGLGDDIAWELFADLGAEVTIRHAATVYGKRFTSAQGRLI